MMRSRLPVTWRVPANEPFFIHVPRTAGRSVSRALREDFRSIPTRPAHWQIDFARQNGIYAGDKSFAFVRNPYHRMVSAYLTTSNPDPHVERPSLADMRRRLRFFILGTFRERPLPTAWDHVSIDGAVAVNWIGRFENLHADFALLCSWLDIPQRELTPTGTWQRLIEPYEAYYDVETRDVVRSCHAKDFEMFGYWDDLDLS